MSFLARLFGRGRVLVGVDAAGNKFYTRPNLKRQGSVSGAAAEIREIVHDFSVGRSSASPHPPLNPHPLPRPPRVR